MRVQQSSIKSTLAVGLLWLMIAVLILGGVANAADRPSALRLPPNTSNLPDDIDDDTVMRVVAQNQPAVVRILTLLCADVSLVQQKGTVTFKEVDVCNGGVGSGSFISEDGYIATNGHVVTVPEGSLLTIALSKDKNHTATLLKYLLAEKRITKKQYDSYAKVISSQPSQASAILQTLGEKLKPSDIKLSNKQVTYGVQISDDPIRLDKHSDKRIKIIYNKTNIAAKFIDMDYNPTTSTLAMRNQGTFTSSDVALLKVEGSFPAVSIGSTGGLQQGDQLTAIGYPGFVDNSVNTDNFQTVPSVTQGEIQQFSTDNNRTDGRLLISTDVPIAQGNSGGPAFNDDGEQVGLNTYGNIKCPDRKCFGDGIVRGIEDLQRLVRKNKVTLKPSAISKNWRNALAAYNRREYSRALELFEQQREMYAANYLVASLTQQARERTNDDLAKASNTPIILISVFAGLGLLLVILITILIIVLVRRGSRQSLR